MNANDFLPFLGQTDDLDEITKLLVRLGVTKHPKPKKGEMEAYVELPKQGLMLVFSRLLMDKTSKLALTDVQLFSEVFGHGYDAFAGKLPHGLLLTDLRGEVHRKLGEPRVANHKLGIERWSFDGYDLVAEFGEEPRDIWLLHLAVPQERG